MFRQVISGNLTKDPIQRKTQNNKNITNITVAVSIVGDNFGEKDTLFVGVSCFGKCAIDASKLRKGNAVTVDGKAKKPYIFTNSRTGEPAVLLQMIADEITWLSPPREEGYYTQQHSNETIYNNYDRPDNASRPQAPEDYDPTDSSTPGFTVFTGDAPF